VDLPGAADVPEPDLEGGVEVALAEEVEPVRASQVSLREGRERALYPKEPLSV
jgi:hypothetical protein